MKIVCLFVCLFVCFLSLFLWDFFSFFRGGRVWRNIYRESIVIIKHFGRLGAGTNERIKKI